MSRYLSKFVLAAGIAGAAFSAHAGQFDTEVPMLNGGASTFYVPAKISGLGDVKLMVDTGSGYMTINESVLDTLKGSGNAQYVKDLRGVLANGSELIVPVYKLKSVNIGGSCVINDVEAAVFPGKTRFILGLSALKQRSPFIFSMDPANLVLSNCGPGETVASKEQI